MPLKVIAGDKTVEMDQIPSKKLFWPSTWMYFIGVIVGWLLTATTSLWVALIIVLIAAVGLVVLDRWVDKNIYEYMKEFSDKLRS